jgi:phage terminase large subunit-like protein
MKLGCLIAPTAADIRDVMVEGPSGLLAVAAVVPGSGATIPNYWREVAESSLASEYFRAPGTQHQIIGESRRVVPRALCTSI